MAHTRTDEMRHPRPEHLGRLVGAMIGVVLGAIAIGIGFNAAGLTFPEGAVLGVIVGGYYASRRWR